MQIYRYNAAMPVDLFRELEECLEERGETVIELLKKLIRVGLLILKTQSNGGEVIIREGDQETKILIY